MFSNLRLVFVLFVATAAGDIFEECNRSEINDRTFVSSSQSCRHYIFCDGDNSYEGECGEDEYFNVIFQTCDPQSMVDCQIEQVTSLPINDVENVTATAINSTAATSVMVTLATTTLTNSTGVTLPTAPTAPTASSTNLTAAFTSPPTPPPTISNSTESPTTLASNTTDATTSDNSLIHISTECPATDNPQYMILIPHTKSCSDYFICYQGEPIPMHCSAMLHFNVNSGKCDYAENAKCNNLDFSTPREQCQPHTIDVYPHPSNCNYYYLCKNGYLLLQQCPFFFGWDFERRSCVRSLQAKCYNKQLHFQ